MGRVAVATGVMITSKSPVAGSIATFMSANVAPLPEVNGIAETGIQFGGGVPIQSSFGGLVGSLVRPGVSAMYSRNSRIRLTTEAQPLLIEPPNVVMSEFHPGPVDDAPFGVHEGELGIAVGRVELRLDRH